MVEKEKDSKEKHYLGPNSVDGGVLKKQTLFGYASATFVSIAIFGICHSGGVFATCLMPSELNLCLHLVCTLNVVLTLKPSVLSVQLNGKAMVQFSNGTNDHVA